MRKFTKEEFCAWLAEQGDRPYDSGDPQACVMTQFAVAKLGLSEVAGTYCNGYKQHKGLHALIYSDGRNRNDSVFACIDLTQAEINQILTAKTFVALFNSLTGASK